MLGKGEACGMEGFWRIIKQKANEYMTPKETNINLYRNLEILHFLNEEDCLLVFLELCLYVYLSKDEPRKRLIKEYSVDDRYCSDIIAHKLLNNPSNALFEISEVREHFARSGKNSNAKKILELIFGGTQAIQSFRRIDVKNTRYINSILYIIRNMKDPEVVVHDVLEYAIPRVWTRRGSVMSPSIASMIAKFSAMHSATSAYDPITRDSSIIYSVGRTKKLNNISCSYCSNYDAVISLILAILSGYSFGNLSFEIAGPLYGTDFDNKKFDLIVSNIPARTRISQDDLFRYSNDPLYIECFAQARPTLETLVFKKTLHCLKPGGHAYLIVAGNILGSQASSDKQFRSELVNSGCLKSIIKIPNGALGGTSVESFIISLEKAESTTVSFMDSSSYFDLSKAAVSIPEENIDKLLSDIRNGRNLKNVSLEDIKNDDNRLNVAYYTDSPKLEQIFKEGNCKKLLHVAEILSYQPTDNEEIHRIVNLKELDGYPFVEEKMCTDGLGSILLRRNDIIVHGNLQEPKVYLFQDEITNIYAPKSCIVIRPTEVQPEYLAVYLSSEAAKTALELIQKIHRGGKSFFRTVYITSDLLSELPVPNPGKKTEEYKERFRIENKYHIKYEDLLFFLDENKLQNNDENPTIDSLLDEELLRNAPRYKREVFEDSMNRDIDELKICYANGAYKAATILAGSILEAILIDWLSEIWKTDYFTEEFPTGDGHKATLADYINKIKFIKQPAWMKEAEEAHHIRAMRNSVHAKISIGQSISRKDCDKVIKYLQDVLVSRKANS